MHTAQDGDKRLAELWDKNMHPAGYAEFCLRMEGDKNAIRKFASDLVDDKFQQLQMERDRLKQFEIAFGIWSDKTDWVQDSPNTRFAFIPLGMHRADVMRNHIENLEAELAAMKSANTPNTQPEPAETEDERMGREAYEDWRAGDKRTLTWEGLKEELYTDRNLWIAFAKRRPKVVPPAPKLREPGQVLLESLFAEGLWVGGAVDDLSAKVDRIARKLGIEAQP